MPSPLSEIASSSIAIIREGRSWVIIASTLGELGPLEAREANSDMGVAAISDSGSDILGSSTISLVDATLPVTSEILTVENQNVLPNKILLFQVTHSYYL